MKEKLLHELQEELKKKKNKLSEYNENVRRIKELLLEDNVKEFISISKFDIKKLNIKEKTEEDIKKETIDNIIYFINDDRNIDTNKIYCCLGEFEGRLRKDGGYGYLERKSNKNSFTLVSPKYVKVYRNIENSNDEVILPIKECNNFEKKHLVINSNNYSMVQREFITDMLDNNQEEAVKRLMKKYK